MVKTKKKTVCGCKTSQNKSLKQYIHKSTKRKPPPKLTPEKIFLMKSSNAKQGKKKRQGKKRKKNYTKK
jgi:hypothetical protein